MRWVLCIDIHCFCMGSYFAHAQHRAGRRFLPALTISEHRRASYAIQLCTQPGELQAANAHTDYR